MSRAASCRPRSSGASMSRSPRVAGQPLARQSRPSAESPRQRLGAERGCGTPFRDRPPPLPERHGKSARMAGSTGSGAPTAVLPRSWPTGTMRQRSRLHRAAMAAGKLGPRNKLTTNNRPLAKWPTCAVFREDPSNMGLRGTGLAGDVLLFWWWITVIHYQSLSSPRIALCVLCLRRLRLLPPPLGRGRRPREWVRAVLKE